MISPLRSTTQWWLQRSPRPIPTVVCIESAAAPSRVTSDLFFMPISFPLRLTEQPSCPLRIGILTPIYTGIWRPRSRGRISLILLVGRGDPAFTPSGGCRSAVCSAMCSCCFRGRAVAGVTCEKAPRTVSFSVWARSYKLGGSVSLVCEILSVRLQFILYLKTKDG
jgi:hypothetical protein